MKNKPNTKIGLYSIFAPMWLNYLDRNDIRIFIERENLHKKHMQQWLHRFLDNKRIDLSLGFDEINHPQYMRFPFWLMWNIFSPTATHNEIKQQIKQMNSPENQAYENRKFCAFLCNHDDIGRKKIFNQLNGIDKVDCDGALFHNNDELKLKYDDDKLKYLTHYRFNLTPENSNYDGYVTEKLFEAIYAGCVPIYHGSDNRPEANVLNPKAIVFIEMGKDNNDAIKLIEELNTDKKKYMEFACQKRFITGADEVIWGYYESLENKIKEIIDNV
nr:glycosyltransferase family 10 [Bacteroides hominis (ex Liu et al. 2022)]MDV6151804.1 glycosyltransferase family 10 [Bacteroides hominis (ex Liu et al. 2022)]